MSPDAVTPRRWGWERWVLVAFLLLGWALRLPPVLDNRFHADEALYGYWGLLIGRGLDPWLAQVPAYKPPLLPYLVAGAEALLGTSELAVRLPGLAAGWLVVPLVAALAQALYGDRWVAIGSAVGVALSPFAILFSATAFTDLPMVALGVGSCLAAARGRPGWAGLLAGLAFAAKQTGLAWMPLAAAVSICHLRHFSFVISSSVISSFGIPFGVVGALVFAWDAVRVARGAVSFWRLGVTGYGGLRLIWPQELWTRLRDWLGLARYFFVSPIVYAVLAVGLCVLVWNATRRGRYTRTALIDLILVSFLLIYALFHWLWAFPVWDRYLLPLVPILALLLGRTITLLATHLPSAARRASLLIHHPPNSKFQTPNSKLQSPFSLLPSPFSLLHPPISNLPSPSSILHSPFSILPSPSYLHHWSSLICHLSFLISHFSLAILLLLPALNAARSSYPVGGDHWAYDGIDEVARFLRGLPEGVVVYQHWLGWHYSDYLFDAPVYVAYWPNPAWLARDVQAFGTGEPRYITFPSWESPARVGWALAGVGYELTPVLTTTRRDDTHSFTVYHIQPLSDL